MEIKIDKKDLVFVIAGVLGFLAFFLPWFTAGMFGSASGYNAFRMGIEIDPIAWPLILIPIGFLASALTRLGVFKTNNTALQKLLDLTPILVFVFYILYLFAQVDFDLSMFQNINVDATQAIGFGLILTIVASIILMFGRKPQEKLNLD